MNVLPISLRFKDNYSVCYFVDLDELENKTIRGLINHLYNTKFSMKDKMDEFKINIDNFGLFPREGPYGLISLNSLPLDANLEDDSILFNFRNSVIYLLREGSTFY
jgi:hypothetical protein